MLMKWVFAPLAAILIAYPQANAAPLASEPSSWKSPLGADAMITQGPKETLDCSALPPNRPSHCDGSWNTCAVDLAIDMNTPLLAPTDGQIVRQNFDTTGGGYFLVVEHGDGGRASLFLHLNGYKFTDEQVRVSPGGIAVRQGDVIGYSGIGGTGPHLHFTATADKSLSTCIGMYGIDGNNNLSKRANFHSTNRQNGASDPPATTPVSPAPPISDQPGIRDWWDALVHRLQNDWASIQRDFQTWIESLLEQARRNIETWMQELWEDFLHWIASQWEQFVQWLIEQITNYLNQLCAQLCGAAFLPLGLVWVARRHARQARRI